MTDLPHWCKPGVSFTLDYGPENPASKTVYHVRGIVDGRAVMRYWRPVKRRWEYFVEDDVYFMVLSANIRVR